MQFATGTCGMKCSAFPCHPQQSRPETGEPARPRSALVRFCTGMSFTTCVEASTSICSTMHSVTSSLEAGERCGGRSASSTVLAANAFLSVVDNFHVEMPSRTLDKHKGKPVSSRCDPVSHAFCCWRLRSQTLSWDLVFRSLRGQRVSWI